MKFWGVIQKILRYFEISLTICLQKIRYHNMPPVNKIENNEHIWFTSCLLILIKIKNSVSITGSVRNEFTMVRMLS